jgi:Flp pilus assembly pilin Flp
MMLTKSNKQRKQSGQTMTEYIIITALIAVALISTITIFGGNIKRLWQGAIEAVKTGDTGAANTFTDKMENGAAAGEKQKLPDLGGGSTSGN